MPLNTNKLKLPYIAPNEPITSQIESIRYNIIDVQLAALFDVLGPGVIEGWNITTIRPTVSGNDVIAPPDSVYISPGNGHINSLATETSSWTTLSLPYIGTLDNPLPNYIYAGVTDRTPLQKTTKFIISSGILNHADIILLGIVTTSVDEGGKQTISIDTSGRSDIGFLSKFLSLLFAHRHGREGVSPIDLSSEVKGFLSSDNIGDIPAERITSGIINPQRFLIDHLNLLNSGELSHSDLDSAVEMLQKANKKLFGDISTTNLLQLITAAKEGIINVDRNFRNLMIIIPGIDNNTFANTKSFLDPEYVLEKNMYEDGEESYIVDGKEIFVKKDASIIDYVTGVIYGKIASGLSVHEINIDNAIEFSSGEYDPTFIEITSINDYGYIYGYGFGYGLGLDYFDVFGVASGITDKYGNESHIGFGTDDFELNNPYSYAYGYGTELIDGSDPFLHGRAIVTLKQNPSDIKLYRFDFKDGDPKQDTPLIDPSGDSWVDKVPDSNFDIDSGGPENEELINGVKVYNRILERCEFYRTPSGTSGSVAASAVKNRRLVYLINPDDPNDIDRSDWSQYNTFQIKINPSSLNASGVWKLIIYSEKQEGLTYSIQPSAPITIINDFFNGPIGEEKIIPIDLALVVSSNPNFNINRIIKVEIIDITPLPIPYPELSIIPWSSEIIEMGLSGGFTFSKVDSNNTLEKLYIVIPFNPAATLKNISWIGEEQGDSRILIYIKAADANNTTTDGFELLENTSFGNPYTNKANLYPGDPITAARPSGSDITEGSATHVEIKVVLQPSVDGNTAPVLNSITLRYSVAGQDEEIIFDSDEDFNINTVLGTQRTNIKLNTESDLIIDKINDVSIRNLGLNDRFEQIEKESPNNNLYKLITNINNKGENCIKTIDNYLSNQPARYNKISSLKKLSDGNLLLCDTMNHRLVCIKQNNNSLVWCISGIASPQNESLPLTPVFAHYNTKENIIYIGFSKALSNISDINNSILIGSFITDSDTSKSFTTGQGGDEVSVVYASNSVENISNLIRIKLSQSTINKINTLKDDLAIILNGESFNISSESTLRLPIEKWNVYYSHISYPIDIKADVNNNIICAQSIIKENIDGQIEKNDNFNSIIKFNLQNLDLYNIENIISKWDFSIYQNTTTYFDFDPTYCGSVEEIINNLGEKELLVADFNNKRVSRIKQDTSELVWQIDSNATDTLSYYFPSGLYPTCAILGDNGLFYISLTNPTGEDSRIVEVNNSYKLLRTFFNGRIKNPQDIYYLDGDRLLISS